MRFQKRSGQSRDPVQEKSLYPVLYVTNVLKDYQKDLLQKEVQSLRELGMVRSSFNGVLEETENFQQKLEDFEETLNLTGRV